MTTLQKITDATEAEYGLTTGVLRSGERTHGVTAARHVAFAMAREYTDHSLGEIGAFFGSRDHSTVANGLRKYERDIRADERHYGKIKAIRAAIDGPKVEFRSVRGKEVAA